MTGPRRRARTLALQALSEADTAGHSAEDVLARLVAKSTVKESVADFAGELVSGVQEHRQRIDEVISKAAPAWPVHQLAPVDRNILRLAILEILINNRTPVRAAINEAVELAKGFGSESSGRFVNGVLGSVSLMTTR
jgi:N utilization substance protein B